jgi:hypothetical protein
VRRALAFLAGCLLALNLHASTEDLMGSRSCGKWIEERRMESSTKPMNKIPVLITRSWFLGYLSGRAEASGRNFLKGTDSESIFLWLDVYCRANPAKDLDSAGIDLARELMQMKGIKP